MILDATAYHLHQDHITAVGQLHVLSYFAQIAHVYAFGLKIVSIG